MIRPTMFIQTHAPVALALVALLSLSGAALSDDQQPPTDPPIDQPPAEQPPAEQPTDDQPPAEQPPSSLDDLLGLDEEEADRSGEDAAARDADAALQRRLTGEQIADAFRDALEKMSVSAALLDNDFDAGIGTQRVQEDVLARLQQLIDEARRQQSSSSSSQSSQSQQQQQQQQADPGRQQQQGQNQGEQQAADGNAETDGPPLQEGDVNVMLEETRSEWGALPQRVREMLLQGRQERFSSLYEQLTREYYRRLAEE